jgi:hypothetical protein
MYGLTKNRTWRLESLLGPAPVVAEHSGSFKEVGPDNKIFTFEPKTGRQKDWKTERQEVERHRDRKTDFRIIFLLNPPNQT